MIPDRFEALTLETDRSTLPLRPRSIIIETSIRTGLVAEIAQLALAIQERPRRVRREDTTLRPLLGPPTAATGADIGGPERGLLTKIGRLQGREMALVAAIERDTVYLTVASAQPLPVAIEGPRP